jgi:hypothetical protein
MQREMMRETGLEAGELVDGERSCFKASSGDHPKFRTTRLTPILPPSDIHATSFDL